MEQNHDTDLVQLAAGGDELAAAELLRGLDARQMRALAAVVATRAGTALASSIGPRAVCGSAVDAAATTFGTTPDAILGSTRRADVKTARHVAMAAARRNGLTLPEVALFFDKHHTSVMHAVRQVEADPTLDGIAARIADGIQHRTEALKAARQTRGSARRQAMTRPATPPTHLRGVKDMQPAQIHTDAVAAAAQLFSITPRAVCGDRHRASNDARAVAMAAARENGLSEAQVAQLFGRHRTSVHDAVNRAQSNPLLRAATDMVNRQLQGDAGLSQAPDLAARAMTSKGGVQPTTWTPRRGAAQARRGPAPEPATIAVAR